MNSLSTSTPYALSAPPPPATEPLRGDVHADAVILGAGYGGLSAALDLAGRGMRVVVLEAGAIGSGGAGLNHGHCTPIFTYLDETRLPPAGFAILKEAGSRVFDLIRRYGIACEAMQAGAITAAHTPAALARITRQRERYAAIGKASPMLDREALAALTGAEGLLGGWVHHDGGHLNPLGYVRGLAAAALAEGVAVHTHAPAVRIARSPKGWRIETPEGAVTAPRLGLAVNAYPTGAARAPSAGEIPVTAYGIASAPLSPVQRARVLPGGHTLGDTRHDPRFLRIDAAGRLIAGGLLELGRGRLAGLTMAHMTARFEAMFPGIEPLDWTHLWRGTLAFTPERAPRLYRLGEGFFALSGFSGRGVPTATALGAVLAGALCDDARAETFWPVSAVGRLPGRHLIGFLLQSGRGPGNRVRDWLEGTRGTSKL